MYKQSFNEDYPLTHSWNPLIQFNLNEGSMDTQCPTKGVNGPTHNVTICDSKYKIQPKTEKTKHNVYWYSYKQTLETLLCGFHNDVTMECFESQQHLKGKLKIKCSRQIKNKSNVLRWALKLHACYSIYKTNHSKKKKDQDLYLQYCT